MQVVLLAAGLGSRLGSLTRDIPKALIPVAGRTLLERCLEFIARLEPREAIVVGGFGFEQVRETLAKLDPARPPHRLVENRDFRQGNVLSLQAARPFLDDTFVLMNVDHLYRPAIAALVRQPATEVTAFIDTDRPLGADDMKVERAAGRIRRIAKTLETFDCGYVGMTLVPRPAQAAYFAALDAALAADGPTIHVERVLGRLAEGEAPPACRDISGHGWLEVDTPDERAHAEQVLEEATRAGTWG